MMIIRGKKLNKKLPMKKKKKKTKKEKKRRKTRVKRQREINAIPLYEACSTETGPSGFITNI